MPASTGRPGALLLAVAAALAAAPGGARPDAATAALASFRAAHGPSWALTASPDGRNRRLAGGSLPLEGVEAARSLLASNEALFGLEAQSLRWAGRVQAGSRLEAWRFERTHGGVPVEGEGVLLVLSGGRLLHVQATGGGRIRAESRPAVGPAAATEASFRAVGLAPREGRRLGEPRLLLRAAAGGHRLAWRVDVIEVDRPARWRCDVDARDGSVLAVTDETVSDCPAEGKRRALGAVRPERADEAERRELLPLVAVDGRPADGSGLFVPPQAPYAGALSGPTVDVSCVECEQPAVPSAPVDADGHVDFGSGGLDQVGNGTSTPADRTAYFHVEAARRWATRWLELPWLGQPLDVQTNAPFDCNARWDGRGLHFFRSSDRCANSGEVRDVVVHEWAHGLDANDGLPPSSTLVDAATGEAVADVAAMLRSRDACIGESYRLDPAEWPSDACSGVRDLDESAPGHRSGTLTTSNLLGPCRWSGTYRGPLAFEGHCEGQVLGQAFWHLVQNLRTGRSQADGAPLPDGALPEDQAWEVVEALFFRSRALMQSYAPSSLQSIGLSAHDALLLADDEGDGVANGTPHAAAILDALAHHELLETGGPLADTDGCAAPPDPLVTVEPTVDELTGLPAVRVSWTGSPGAASHRVVRALDPGESYLPLGAPRGPGPGSLVDGGVLPGRSYLYRVIAETAAGCPSPSAEQVSGVAGASLRVRSVRVADAVGGNGDGLLERGEVADLYFELENDGLVDLPALAVTLTAPPAGLTVLDPGPVAYGPIVAGAVAAAPGAFRVRAEGDVAGRVLLSLLADSAAGCLRADSLLTVATVDLRVVSRRVDDGGGDADGLWEPGETIALDVELENAGDVDALDVRGQLRFRSTPPPGISLVRRDASWGDIPVGGSGTPVGPGLLLAASEAVGLHVSVPLVLEIRSGGAVHRRVDVDLIAGRFPEGCRPREEEWCDVAGPGCSDRAGQAGTACSERVATQWLFDEGTYCMDCRYTFFVLVECGRSMHLPTFDVEAMDLTVTNVLTGESPSLRCRMPGWDETDNAGPGRVVWGYPDCGEGSGANGQTMDCFIEAESGLCGIYRLDVLSGGFIWRLFTNCAGDETPNFDIYHDCTEAFADFTPLPDLALANLTVEGSCPLAEVRFDLQNVGCAEQTQDVPVRLRSSCGDERDLIVPAPIPAGGSVTVEDALFVTECGRDLTVEVLVDPDDQVLECAESQTASACDTAAGTEALEAPFTCCTGDVPVAAFTHDSRGGGAPCRGEAVDFTDQSTGVVTSVLWDFGDGTSSTELDPSHVYDRDGVFVVSLTACNDCGCSAPAFSVVEVAASCNTNCEANSNQVGCTGGTASIEGDTCLEHDAFNTTSYPCAPGLLLDGENRIHDLNFTAGSNFVVKVVETVAEPNGYDLDLLIARTCNPPECVAWGDQTVLHDDRTAANDDYWLIVDGRDGTCGPYRIEVECLDDVATAACRPPVFAGLAEAVPDPCSASGVLLRWEPTSDWGTDTRGTPCDSGVFEVWRAPAADPAQERRVGTVPAGETTFLDAAATPDESWTYRVHAINACCAEPALTSASITVANPLRQPLRADAGPDRVLTCLQPALLLATLGGSDGLDVDVSWSPPENVADPNRLDTVAVRAGRLTLSVTERATGCTSVDEVEVRLDPRPEAREPSDLDRRPLAPPLRLEHPVLGGPSALRATWEAVAAPEYRVLEGSVDALRRTGFDHVELACGLEAPAHAFEARAGDAYYLIVSVNCGDVPSSAGRRSDGIERDAGPGSCP